MIGRGSLSDEVDDEVEEYSELEDKFTAQERKKKRTELWLVPMNPNLQTAQIRRHD